MNIRTSDNIIMLQNEVKYLSIKAINLLTDLNPVEAETILIESFYEKRNVILILNKIDNIERGYKMTYKKSDLENIIKFINENNDKFQVISYPQLFEYAKILP